MIVHLKYLWYIIRHKWFVFLECCKLGIPLRGFLHDLSKFRPSEWMPYARYFYGDYPEWDVAEHLSTRYPYKKTKKGTKRAFDYAWLHHQKRNKHHWQYWLLQEDNGKLTALDMPEKYCKEMLADWRGAGRAITGKDDTKGWYEKNKDKMVLHKTTKAWIEDKLFSEMDKYWEEKILNAGPEVKQIVNDWSFGKCVHTNEYMSKYTDKQNRKAYEIIMEAISDGLG